MKYFFLFIGITSFMNGFTQSDLSISGKLSNHENILPIEINSELEPIAGYPSKNIIFPGDSGQYSMTCSISDENYFRIGRNVVYLAPGANVVANINYNWPDSSTFFGDFDKENNYLRSTPFPFGGSFLEGGDRIYKTLMSTVDSIFYFAERRQKKLNGLSNISEKFRKFEKIRITSDIINSLKYLSFYYADANKLSGDSLKKIQVLCNNFIKKYVGALSPTFFKSDYLRLEVYRNILPHLIEYGKFSAIEKNKISDWKYSVSLIYKMKTNEDVAQLNSFHKSIDSVRNRAYAQEILKTYEYLKSINGENAYDFELTDIKGNNIKLSSFKGKWILIDLWATWCGPCIKQMDAWEKYKTANQNNNDLVILTVSMDGNLKLWKSFIDNAINIQTHFNAPPNLLEPYRIIEIPRTIIINREFKIAAFRGPKIDDPDFGSQISAIINKEKNK